MCLKFPLSSYTMLPTHNIAWRKFYSLFLKIVKREERKETQNCPNSSFPIIFVTDCLKNLQNSKCGILQLLILNQIGGMHLPIKSLLYKS